MGLYWIKTEKQESALEKLTGHEILGVDIETGGKNGLIPFQSRVRLIQIATPEDTVLVDLAHIQMPDKLLDILVDPQVTKIFHNAKFDVKHLLHHYNIEVSPVFCTFLASKLLSAGNHHHRHSLESVCKRFLNEKVDKSMQTSDWTGTLTEAQIQYAARDAELLLPLYDEMSAQIHALKLKKVSQLEFKTILPVAAMELNGITLDLSLWNELTAKYYLKMRLLEEELSSQLTDDQCLPGLDAVNLNSPDQVKRALEKRGYKLQGTSEKELRVFASKDPVVEKLLEYRHISRIHQSTLTSFREHVLPETGRIHSSYFQISSASGRFSCSEPNIQQVPREKEIRRAFIPAPGHCFLIADYSQVELRVAAGLSGDPIMLKAYRSGRDLHRLTASLTTGIPYDAITKQERQAAKAINFGLIYAMGPKGLQSSAQASYGVAMSSEEAQTFHRKFFENYKGLARWHRQLEQTGKASRYIRTASGRIRRYHDEHIRITELFNTPVQGTAAEILKASLCIFYDQVKKEKLDANLVAIIHDEVIVETPEPQTEATKKILLDAMLQAASWLVPQVPFEVDLTIANSWAGKQ